MTNGLVLSHYKIVTRNWNSQVQNTDNNYRVFIANPIMFIANPITVNSSAIP